MFIMSPTWGMLFNQKLNRWHPILFRESPLPGEPSEDKPLRLKSFGHHTEGFESRDAALASIKETSAKIEPPPVEDVEKDIPWDGESEAASVAFLKDNKLVFL